MVQPRVFLNKEQFPMRRTIGLPAFLAAVPLCMSLAAADESAGSGSAIESVRLGDHWYGPKLTTEDLKGRVVLIEFWGRN
jgi:hypothetical protein